MIRKIDSEFYAERLGAEREAVARATTAAARRAHESLADRYAALLAGDAQEPLSEAAPQTASETRPLSGA